MRLFLFSVAALFVSSAAVAQSGPPGGGFPGGGGMGGGHGGRGGRPGGMRGPGGQQPPQIKPLERKRLDKPVAEMFAAADSNRDGIVTLAELQAIVEARRAKLIKARFERIDANHNGAISLDEFVAWQHGLGSVASSEEQSVIEGPIGETLGPDLGESIEDRVLSRVIEPLSATLIAAANTNYDAGISLEELLAYERARFDRLDEDHDGALTMLELRKLNPRRGDRGPEDRPPPEQ